MSTVPNGAYVSQASALRVARREFEPGPIVRVRFYSHTWHGRPRWGYVREGSVFDKELTQTQTIDGRHAAATGYVQLGDRRRCLCCLERGKKRTASMVASDSTGLQWFECKRHPPDDNIARVMRVRRESIKSWRKRNGLLESSELLTEVKP